MQSIPRPASHVLIVSASWAIRAWESEVHCAALANTIDGITTTPEQVWSGRATYAIALASSSGGLTALGVLLTSLPAELRAAVLVVQHLDPRHPSLLWQVLARQCLLPVREAVEGELVTNGRVYVARPGLHLLLTPEGTIFLSSSEKVHFVRPSADNLFESVATSFKDRAIAVILTGTGHDGTDGAKAIKREGGVVIAQDEASSEFFGMPSSAIRTGDVDYVLPLAMIGPTLHRLVSDEDRI